MSLASAVRWPSEALAVQLATSSSFGDCCLLRRGMKNSCAGHLSLKANLLSRYPSFALQRCGRPNKVMIAALFSTRTNKT
uniref:Putative secreted protein n=1 Tax=Ixodes ricinus TaxID=34613 RepID=A0A6B0U4G9_IXORI